MVEPTKMKTDRAAIIRADPVRFWLGWSVAKTGYWMIRAGEWLGLAGFALHKVAVYFARGWK